MKIKSEFEPKKRVDASIKNKPDATTARKDLRSKLVGKYKAVQEQELEKVKHRLKKAKTSGILESVLKKAGQRQDRSPSVNSISSDDDDSVLNGGHPKSKKMTRKNGEGSSGSLSDSADGT